MSIAGRAIWVRTKSRVALAIAVGLLFFAWSQPSHANCAKIKITRPGEVYLMRGLANIFSLGLDTFGKELSELGIENCVFNHHYWQGLVDDIVERNHNRGVSHPIIIIGHSLGANIAPKMATAIGRFNIPVAYVVMLDPVEHTTVGANVEEILNFYLPHRKDNHLSARPEFTGELKNINLKQFGGFDHFNVDENHELRVLMRDRILELSDLQMAEKEG